MDQPLADFLAELSKTPRPPFRPVAYHNKIGDIMEVFWEDVPYIAKWVSPTVTLLRAADNDRIVGVQVWGASKIVEDQNGRTE